MGLALPTASIAITSGVQSADQGLAGALFTTGQQASAAVGLGVLAIVAAARTPVGAFNGAFATLPAHELGKVAIQETLKRAAARMDRILKGTASG